MRDLNLAAIRETYSSKFGIRPSAENAQAQVIELLDYIDQMQTVSEGDGPAPVLVAQATAEMVRTLNHLTVTGDGGLGEPSDLHRYVAALAQMAERLPQTLRQAARIARDTADLPGLRDDRSEPWRDARTTAFDAAERLDSEPASLVGDLGFYLRGASDVLSHLGVRDA